MANNSDTIWIIGASDGIGLATAKLLDQAGKRLILSARNETKLREMAEEMILEPIIVPMDVTNVTHIQTACEAVKNACPHIDSVLYFPGFYEPGPFANATINSIDQHIKVNLSAVMYVAHFVLPMLQSHDKGQFIICSSVAGFCGMPNGQPYSATKAAVTNFAESLRIEYPALDIKVIHPGFVKTRLTEKNNFKMPALQTPEQAASFIVKGMGKKAFEIAFPGRFVFALKCLKIMPYWLYFLVFKR